MPTKEPKVKNKGVAEAAPLFGRKLTTQTRNVALTDAEWNRLRVASVKGASDTELSEQYGIRADTIRQRRYNDPIWRTAFEQRELIVAHQSKVSLTLGTDASLEEMKNEGQFKLARFLHSKILGAIEHNLLPDITTWNEMNIVTGMLRKALGLDNQTTNVQVNLWSGSPASQAPSVVMDAEIVQDKCSDEEWI